VRRFRPEPVPREVIERLLETAIYAPSAHNLQPWRFVVLTGVQAKARLAEALTDRMRRDMQQEGAAEEEIAERVARSRRRLHEAPVVILLNRDTTVVRREVPEENRMACQSVAIVGLQLWLAAHAEGLGAVWVCWPLFAPEATRQALDLPSTWEPQGMLFAGYPAEEPPLRPRTLWQDLTRWLEE
jgi:Nitroreductase